MENSEEGHYILSDKDFDNLVADDKGVESEVYLDTLVEPVEGKEKTHEPLSAKLNRKERRAFQTVLRRRNKNKKVKWLENDNSDKETKIKG